MEMKWNQDETSELVRLWPLWSASQLAEKFGRSRMAICGKVNRLCREGMLAARLVKHYEVEPAFNRRPPKPSAAPRPRPAEKTPIVIHNNKATTLVMRPCSLLELDEHRCHWPLDIKNPEPATLFCGGVAVPGLPYCAHHTYRARQNGEYRHERNRHY